MDVKNEVLSRIYIIVLIVFIVAAVIFGKVIKIQFVEGEQWTALNDKSFFDQKPVKAERGDILSDDGERLVTSLRKYDIHMDLNSSGMTDEDFYNNVDSLAYNLAKYVDKSMTFGAYNFLLRENRKKKNRYFKIATNIDAVLLSRIKQFPLFNKGKYKGGLIVEDRIVRVRPYGRLAKRTLGSVRENAQDIGLEGYFNTQLQGEVGFRLMQKINKTTWIPVNDIAELEAKKGDDVFTTLNMEYQDILENELERSLKKYNAKQGCAILMDVKTGAIKGIANLSRYKDNYNESYNLAIGSSVEPGSTFKLATIMALMEDFNINLEDSIFIGDGSKKFYDEIMKDASYHGFSKTTIRHAFEVSSNVAMATLVEDNYKRSGVEDGATKFINNFKKWHLNQKTNVEIKGEGSPLVKEAYDEKQDWSKITLPWMAIGYESRFTPLQLLTFYNGVANNGKIMKPFLVSKIKHAQSNSWTTFEPEVLVKKMASNNTVKNAQKLLQGVVVDGTAKAYNKPSYSFSGKTGTAQKNYGTKSKKIEYMASFAGYFPSDKPKYSCIVWVDEPQGSFYGSKVALPVFAEISKKISDMDPDLMENMPKTFAVSKGLLPTYTVGKINDFKDILDKYDLRYINGSKDDWGVMTVKDGEIILKSIDFKKDKVPNVHGLNIMDAIYLLENMGLKVKCNGKGKVYKQSILPGTTLNNQTIYLDLKMKKS